MLPYDNSRCTNAECPLAKRCVRHLLWLSGDGGRVITEFKPINGNCESFIDHATYDRPTTSI
jgi:hypothetical protein